MSGKAGPGSCLDVGANPVMAPRGLRMKLPHAQWDEGRAAREERQGPVPCALSPFPPNVAVRGWSCCSQEAKRCTEMTFTHSHPPEASHLASLGLFFCNPNKLLQWGCLGYF